MASTPALLSVGMRCMHHGYTFLWLPGKLPVFVSPGGKVVVLRVEGDIPYLDKETFEDVKKMSFDVVRDNIVDFLEAKGFSLPVFSSCSGEKKF